MLRTLRVRVAGTKASEGRGRRRAYLTRRGASRGCSPRRLFATRHFSVLGCCGTLGHTEGVLPRRLDSEAKDISARKEQCLGMD